MNIPDRRYAVMLRCLSGTRTLRDYWTRDFHTITVCVETTPGAALASLARFQPSFPQRGERAWIEDYDTRFQHDAR